MVLVSQPASQPASKSTLKRTRASSQCTNPSIPINRTCSTNGVVDIDAVDVTMRKEQSTTTTTSTSDTTESLV